MLYSNRMNILGRMILKLPAKIKTEKSENKREGQSGEQIVLTSRRFLSKYDALISETNFRNT